MKTPFISRALVSILTTGAIFPTSSRLARKITEMIKDKKGLRVLEIGGGNGKITSHICGIAPLASIKVIEINRNFYEDLRKRFEANDRVEVSCDDVFNFFKNYDGAKFDVIVSSIPLTFLSPHGEQSVESFFSGVESLLEPEGTFVMYQYRGKQKAKFLSHFSHLSPKVRWIRSGIFGAYIFSLKT